MVKGLKRNMNNRRDAIFILLITIAILVLANILSQYLYTRFDLTAEKKFSLMPSTIRMVKGLKDAVTFKVYLEGDMPAGFKRLRQSTRDLLNELRAYGGKNIQFEFIDPVTGKSEDERKAILDELLAKGLAPANVQTGSATESKITMVFPCAVAYYYGREYPIQLLENQIGYDQEQVLNNSAISLEYKFATAIQKLTMYRPPKVAFTMGHGELSSPQLADIQQQLGNLRYVVGFLDITKGYKISNEYDAIIIAKPEQPFDEKDKYKIDQYIMHGGKVMWLIDATTADFDSLKVNLTGQFVVDRNLNLDDQLFKYGARVNTDLIEDINMCSPIPLKVGNMGNAPQIELFPWYFFPLLIPANNNPIVKNLDPVAAQFASTVDTIRNPGVKKTILLHTSENAKAVLTPTRVHFGILQQKPNPAYYDQPNLPAAVLLEGVFQSLYQHRLTREFLTIGDTVPELKYVDHSPANKMIVIGDGDIIRNEMRSDGSAYPLGYYSVSRQTMANKDFILNCVQYLTDTSGILETRNKEVKLRLLNKIRVQNEKVKWQVINIIVPIVLVILFGIGFNYFRRKKYAV
jgi:ABC-2 type transport system permease protein